MTLKSLDAEMQGRFDEVHLKIESLDAEMHRQFDEVHSRVDGLGLRIESMDRNFKNRFETASTELSSMREAMDNKFANIDLQFSLVTPNLVKALSPWIHNIEDMLEAQGKRISALEKKRRHLVERTTTT